MRIIALYLPGLTCVGGMFLCMWLMSRRGRSNVAGRAQADSALGLDPAVGDVAQLRAEVARLRSLVDADRQDAPIN